MSLPLTCSSVAKMVGSAHRCQKRNSKRMKNSYTTYSTSNQDHIQLLWALLCKKRKTKNESGKRLSRQDITEIEEEFGSKELCLCKFFTRNIRESIRIVPPRKRKLALQEPRSPTTRTNFPFTVEDDDNSDAEIVCHIINDNCSQVTTSPLSLEGTTISTSSLESPASTASVVQRRRSPRNLPAYNDEETNSSGNNSM